MTIPIRSLLSNPIHMLNNFVIHHRNRPIAVNINLAVLVHQVTKDIKVIADIKEVSIIVIGGHGLEVSIINIDLKSVKQ